MRTMGLRPFVATAAVAACAIWPLAATAYSAGPAGVTFLTGGTFTISIGAAEASHSLDVAIYNGSDSPQTITLQVVGLARGDGLAYPASDIDTGAPRRLDAVAIATDFEVTASRTNAKPGIYAGRLVATSTDGTVAQSAVTVNMADPDASASEPDALRSPLPATVSLQASNWLPSPLTRVFGWKTTSIARAPISTALAATASSSTLVAGDGSRAVAEPRGLAIEVAGLPGSGNYDGKLEFGAAGTTAIAVTVRDFFIWPLLVLILGLVIANRVDWVLSRRVPRSRLALALRQLVQQATRWQEAAAKADTSKSGVYTIWEGGEKARFESAQGALAEAARTALAQFDDNPDAGAAKKEWATSGDKFGDIQALVDGLATLNTSVAKLREQRAALQTRLGDEWERAKDQPVAILSADALVGKPIEHPAGVAETIATVATATALVVAFAAAYDVIARLAAESDPSGKQELEKVRTGLLEGQLQTPAEVTAQRQRAIELAPARAAAAETAELRGDLARFASGAEPPAVARDVLAERERLGREQYAWGLIASVFVVLSGLSAVYLSNATFGSLADYLTAFLWGSVVGTAVTFARRLGPLLPGS